MAFPFLDQFKVLSFILICHSIHFRFILLLGEYDDFLALHQRHVDSNVDSYLYLGNIVNGGNRSTEILFHLLALKINNPHNYFLLRGKSETEEMCRTLNFYTECLVLLFSYSFLLIFFISGVEKYNESIFNECLKLFQSLPIAALVAKKHFFCTPGGLSPQMTSV